MPSQKASGEDCKGTEQPLPGRLGWRRLVRRPGCRSRSWRDDVTQDAGAIKILGKSRWQCGDDIVLLRSQQPCESRGIQRLLTLLMRKKSQNCRSKETARTLSIASPDACITTDCTGSPHGIGGYGGHVQALRNTREQVTYKPGSRIYKPL